MSQQELQDVRPGEPALFHYTIKDSRGTVHLAHFDKTLCGAPRKRLSHVTSPSWWERRCDECFGALLTHD